MSAVKEFSMYRNSFEGALPGVLQVMRDVHRVLIYSNGFKGTLPEEGMRTMTALACFGIQYNGFTGVLPESGLQ
eukprot:6110953-Amphidinium_carterae.1